MIITSFFGKLLKQIFYQTQKYLRSIFQSNYSNYRMKFKTQKKSPLKKIKN